MLQPSGEMLDQAAGLRRVVSPEPVRVVAVTSGKGGVGKTNVSVNLAMAWAQLGKQVMLFDADLGLANVDVLLGLQPECNLGHVLSGERTLEEIIVEGPRGLKIVPASSGVRHMLDLEPMAHAGLIRAFSELTHRVDVLLVDTAAGISDGVTSYVCAAQEAIVVVCDEPASITDAYAMIKVLNRDHGQKRFRVLANMARSVREGYELFNKIARACDKFLDVSLDFMGSVPYDETLRLAVQKQRAVIDAFPSSRAALAFKKLAQKADNWPIGAETGGQVGFFVERLLRAGAERRRTTP
jgi:flagellar biosynthesis protein FlhG